MKAEEININNPGILKFDIPEKLFVPFKENIIKIPESFGNKENLPKSFNNELVGQIQHEIDISCPGFLKMFLLEAAQYYCDYFNYNKEKNVKLMSMWANFQQKTEYNPLHIHGGILSFIIFVQIPFKYSDEDIVDHTRKSSIHRNGRVCFQYNTLFGHASELALNVDESYVGKLLIFPNTAHHIVYPFYTSDDYRITVAGNFEV